MTGTDAGNHSLARHNSLRRSASGVEIERIDYPKAHFDWKLEQSRKVGTPPAGSRRLQRMARNASPARERSARNPSDDRSGRGTPNPRGNWPRRSVGPRDACSPPGHSPAAQRLPPRIQPSSKAIPSGMGPSSRMAASKIARSFESAPERMDEPRSQIWLKLRCSISNLTRAWQNRKSGPREESGGK